MRRFTLFGEGAALRNSEAVLLIDDNKPGGAHSGGFLDKRLGAYQHVYLSGFRAAADVVFLLDGKTAGKQLHPHAKPGEHFSEGLVMLLRQNLRGSHNHGSVAVQEREIRRSRRDQRLAAANVALYQPVHREFPLHIRDTVPDGVFLRVRRFERQRPPQRSYIRRLHDCAGVLPAPALHHGQPQFKGQQLLEHQTAARFCILLPGARKVYLPYRSLPREQPELFNKRLRKALSDSHLLQRGLYVRRHHVVGKPGGKRIFRHEHVLGNVHEQRRADLLSNLVAGYFAVEDVLPACFQPAERVFCIKEHRRDIPGAV